MRRYLLRGQEEGREGVREEKVKEPPRVLPLLCYEMTSGSGTRSGLTHVRKTPKGKGSRLIAPWAPASVGTGASVLL